MWCVVSARSVPRAARAEGAELRVARAHRLLYFRAVSGGVPVRVSALRQWPAEPLAHAAAHHPLEILVREPRQVVREQVDAFVIGARHPCEVGAPEGAPGSERIHEALDRLVRIPGGVAGAMRPITAKRSGWRRAASSARSLRSPSHDGGTITIRLTPARSIWKRSASLSMGYGFCACAARPGGHGRSGVSGPQRCTCESTMCMVKPLLGEV